MFTALVEFECTAMGLGVGFRGSVMQTPSRSWAFAD